MTESSRSECTTLLFPVIERMCSRKIHARLQSKHWIRPPHLRGVPREPLYSGIQKLVTRMESRSQGRQKDRRKVVEGLSQLSIAYKSIDDSADPAASIILIKDAIRKSFEFCTVDGHHSLEETVTIYGFNPAEICQDKTIRQIHKLGRYWGLCVETPKHARKYRNLFQQIKLEFIPSYLPVTSTVMYTPPGAGLRSHVQCYVHAEIQLLVYYDLHATPKMRRPRVVGTSKAACFLCDLFILNHGEFFHTKTHGRLYDHWTIPDHAKYTKQQVKAYRRIILAVDSHVRKAALAQNIGRLPFPNTSWISGAIPPAISPTASDVGTIASRLDGDPISWPITPQGSVCLPSITERSPDMLPDPINVLPPEHTTQPLRAEQRLWNVTPKSEPQHSEVSPRRDHSPSSHAGATRQISPAATPISSSTQASPQMRLSQIPSQLLEPIPSLPFSPTNQRQRLSPIQSLCISTSPVFQSPSRPRLRARASSRS